MRNRIITTIAIGFIVIVLTMVLVLFALDIYTGWMLFNSLLTGD